MTSIFPFEETFECLVTSFLSLKDGHWIRIPVTIRPPPSTLHYLSMKVGWQETGPWETMSLGPLKFTGQSPLLTA